MDVKQAINILTGSEQPAKTVWEFAERVEKWVQTKENILFMTRSEADAMKEFIEQQEKHAELGRVVVDKIDQCSKNVIVCYAHKTCAVKELCYKHGDVIDNDK